MTHAHTHTEHRAHQRHSRHRHRHRWSLACETIVGFEIAPRLRSIAPEQWSAAIMTLAYLSDRINSCSVYFTNAKMRISMESSVFV